MAEKFETVHTVTGYWDQPRSGVAEFQGVPHSYLSIFDEGADDWSPIYWLCPIDSEVFALALEAWALWCRWRGALDTGATTMATFPALRKDQERTEELRAILADRLVVAPATAIKAEPHFQIVPGGSPSRGSMANWRVRWTLISSETSQHHRLPNANGV